MGKGGGSGMPMKERKRCRKKGKREIAILFTCLGVDFDRQESPIAAIVASLSLPVELKSLLKLSTG